MRNCAIVLTLFLLAGCSSTGPWKAPHPEDVAKECPGRELHISAHVEGKGNQSFHELDTQCGEGELETQSTRVELLGKRTGVDLQYKDSDEERTVTIHEHAEKHSEGYDHVYKRRVEPKKSETPRIGSWTTFSIKRTRR